MAVKAYRNFALGSSSRTESRFTEFYDSLHSINTVVEDIRNYKTWPNLILRAISDAPVEAVDEDEEGEDRLYSPTSGEREYQTLIKNLVLLRKVDVFHINYPDLKPLIHAYASYDNVNAREILALLLGIQIKEPITLRCLLRTYFGRISDLRQWALGKRMLVTIKYYERQLWHGSNFFAQIEEISSKRLLRLQQKHAATEVIAAVKDLIERLKNNGARL